MDEKKKLMVLAALAVMTLGIGAFQFMPKGQEPVAEPKKETPAFLKENAEASEATKEAPRNPLLAANLKARDPFKAPDSMLAPVSSPNPVPQLREASPRRPNRQITLGNVRPVGVVEMGELPTSLNGAPVAVEVEAPFAYTVGGVVVGARPAVVFKDAAGNQRLVMQGGDVDGESSLKLVRMDHVVVVHNGKSLRLKVGG